MTSFYEFVKNFCVIAISGGLALASSPEGNIKKYIKYLVSLCVVCALLSPFLSFGEKGGDVFESMDTQIKEVDLDLEKDMQTGVVLAAKENIEAEICALLTSKFALDKKDIYTVVTIESEDLSAVNITDVTVFISDISLREKVYEYVSELFMHTANINIMKKGDGK